MSKVLNINADQFEKEVMRSKTPVLVDFWAPWCMPCKLMGPILDEMAQDLGDKAKVIKVSIDDPRNVPLAQVFQVMSIPNMKIFKGGEVVDEFIGMRSKEDLMTGLGKHI
ncbi:MAG TPA: thioredoxin [Candidatus Paceibacterota bacterium]|nr:thioredoxin [Candidatus Paceibacterota bacterium]